ncbi:MAG: pseudouridine synthase, partial [Terracidiphilus sp.]
PKSPAKPRKAKVKIKSESGELVDIHVPVGHPFQHSGDDPIGDVTDGEAHLSTGTEPESTAETAPAAEASVIEEMPHRAESRANQAPKSEDAAEPAQEPAKLDRLQKILSQAGIASRRRAEELITEGRVQVNGQVVTQLGAKADPARDHIRVDGKLLTGAERHRYFVLNKPKGYVTTVSDPEGRPTVMEFFSKMRERLYPVGRLDYQSEGLLLVTNDGELANQLTRAASGVQKTYLVKVAGQPTEEQLDILRSGVAIDREQPGSGTVHTAPAEVRQVRRGDNPWFEVVLIEGRNRELRKMFSAIGHFVEKIRRVGYGPLVLDVEPGKLRELAPEEVAALRLAAEGKWKPRRPKAAKILPKEARHAAEPRTFKPRPPGGKPFRDQSAGREKPRWKQQPGAREPQRSFRPQGERFGGRSSYGRQQGEQPSPGAKSFGERPQGRPFLERQGFDAPPESRSEGHGSGFRPQQRDRDSRAEEAPSRAWQKSPPAQRGGPARQGDRPYTKRPPFKPSGESRPRFDKPAGRSFSKPFSKPRSGEFAGKPPARFDKPAGRSFSNPRGGEFAGKPPARFDKPAGRTFSKPPSRSFESKPPRGIEIEPVRDFEKPAAKTWSKPTGKTWTPRPAAGRSHAPGRDQARPGRPARSKAPRQHSAANPLHAQVAHSGPHQPVEPSPPSARNQALNPALSPASSPARNRALNPIQDQASSAAARAPAAKVPADASTADRDRFFTISIVFHRWPLQ